MNPEEKKYFEKMINYKTKVKIIYAEDQQETDYISAQIRNTAKDALNESISSKIAKKEISGLLEIINQLKRR